jgi:hypothetical protein
MSGEEEQMISKVVGFGCQFYIKRRERLCSNHAITNQTFCHSHGPIQTTPKTPVIIIKSGKKQNLKRRLKRMLNPFFVRDHPVELEWPNIYSNLDNKLHIDMGFPFLILRMRKREIHSIFKKSKFRLELFRN